MLIIRKWTARNSKSKHNIWSVKNAKKVLSSYGQVLTWLWPLITKFHALRIRQQQSITPPRNLLNIKGNAQTCSRKRLPRNLADLHWTRVRQAPTTKGKTRQIIIRIAVSSLMVKKTQNQNWLSLVSHRKRDWTHILIHRKHRRKEWKRFCQKMIRLIFVMFEFARYFGPHEFWLKLKPQHNR